MPISNNINSIFIAAWYPHEKKHHFGIFIKEHAKSVALFCKVSVIYLRFFKKGFIPKIQVRKEEQGNISVYYINVFSPIRKFGIHDFLVKKAYLKVLKKINKITKIDIVHINVRDKYTKLVTDIPLIKNKPIIVTEHFSFYHTGIKKFPKSQQLKETLEIKKWFTQPNIRYVLPVSNQLGNVLINEFNVNKSNVKIIPNVASKDFYFTPKKKNDIVKIALVANWQAPKNPILFLNVLLKLKTELKTKISIDWIGIGEQTNEIKDFISANLLEYSIKMWGLQEKGFIAEVLRGADFLVQPTDAENLPTIIIESLCCGTPVLTHRVNGIPELINDSNGIMCEAKSIDDLALKLLKMIDSSSNYDSEKIAKNATELFSDQAISNQIKLIYTKVLEQ